ncbi:MAG: L-histidine N(alpha)-methyltransferase [Chloroflexota bacterium]|nr:L-histidine N(alpha)-methyltransferase [Chloroflexota bacterium]
MTQARSFGSESLDRQLWHALRTRHAVPLKYVYLSEGANRHRKLVLSEEYGLAGTEAVFLDSRLSKIAQSLPMKGVNVLDVGCGVGLKAISLAQYLFRQQGQLDYYLLDISSRMIEIASTNIRGFLPEVNVYSATVDFETTPFLAIAEAARDRSSHENLLLFLGNTLGNPFDRAATLLNLSLSMVESDFLLIGVELFRRHNVSSIVSHYANETFYDAVFYGLEHLGVKRSDGTFQVEYDYEANDVLVWFLPSRQITIQLSEGTLEYSPGDRILLMVSHKFTVRELQGLVKRAGLIEAQYWTDDLADYALMLCRAHAHRDYGGKVERSS